jgi:peptidoglycan-N-acetylglucosamine deacetylase
MIKKTRWDRRWWLVIAGLLVPVVGWVLMLNWLRKSNSPQIMGEYYQQIPTGGKMIALTFDDGPDPRNTSEVLKLLTKYNAKATFFVLGFRVAEHPNLVRQIYEQGSQVGNHTWNHPRMIMRTPRFILDQIERTDEAIRQTGYLERIDFRASYGNKLFALPYVLKSMNKRHILYNVIPEDWKAVSAEALFQRMDCKIKDGSIVLLHDGVGDRGAMLSALQLLLEKYTKDGWCFGTVAEMIQQKANSAKASL